MTIRPTTPPTLSPPGFSQWAHDVTDSLSIGYAHPLFGLPSKAYGNSYISQDNMNNVGARWTDRVKHAFNLGDITFRASGGLTNYDIAHYMIGTINTPIEVDTEGIVFIGGAGIAEQLIVGFDPSTDTAAYDGIKNCLRAAILAASATDIIQSTSMTTSGTWATANQTIASGGSWHYSQTAGNYIEFADNTGNLIDLCIPSLDPAQFGRREAIISVGGVTIDTIAPMHSPTIDSSSPGFTPYMYEGINAGGGGTMVRVTVGDVVQSTAFDTVAVDAAFIRSPNPPLIVVLLPVNIELLTTAAYNAVYDACVEATSGLSHVIAVDPTVGFDYNTMIGSDLIHLNDRGQAHYADVVVEALKDIDFRAGQNKVSTP